MPPGTKYDKILLTERKEATGEAGAAGQTVHRTVSAGFAHRYRRSRCDLRRE